MKKAGDQISTFYAPGNFHTRAHIHSPGPYLDNCIGDIQRIYTSGQDQPMFKIWGNFRPVKCIT
jgi:hypothetical protein